jgi:hypothetical protein
MTTVYLTDGFENYPTGWNSSGPTQSGVQKHSGDYSVLINTSGNPYGIAYASKTFSTTTGDFHAQLFIYVDSSTTDFSGVMVIELINTMLFGVTYVSGKYYLKNYDNTLSDPIDTDKWLQIDAYYDYSAGTCTLYVDGVKQSYGDFACYQGASQVSSLMYIGDISSTYGLSQGFVYIDDYLIDDDMTEPTSMTTYTKTYSLDTLLQKLDIPKTYSLDVAIQIQDMSHKYSLDALFKKLGIPTSYDTDVIVKKLDLPESYSIDTLLKKAGIPKPFIIDVLFEKLGIDKDYSIDVFFQRIGVNPYDVDTILKKLGVTKDYSIDSLFKKLDIEETYGVDVLLEKLDIQKAYVIDTIISKLGITKTYSIDTKLYKEQTKTYAVDLTICPHFNLGTYVTDIRLISGEKRKGRMNIVKSKLMEMIRVSDANIATVIDQARMKTWEVAFPLVSVKISQSFERKLSYGNKLPDGTRGQYYLYNFSAHVFTVPNTTDQLKSKDSLELAETICKYLRKHARENVQSGILEIYELTQRESDPEPHGTRKMTRTIITGKILVERPWGTW